MSSETLSACGAYIAPSAYLLILSRSLLRIEGGEPNAFLLCSWGRNCASRRLSVRVDLGFGRLSYRMKSAFDLIGEYANKALSARHQLRGIAQLLDTQTSLSYSIHSFTNLDQSHLLIRRSGYIKGFCSCIYIPLF